MKSRPPRPDRPVRRKADAGDLAPGRKKPRGKTPDGGRPKRARSPERDRRPEVGRVVELDVSSISAEGEGIARFGDYVLFVPESLPGERIEAEVVSTGRRYGRARIRDVPHASPFRTDPACEHFGQCGGCAWQHIEYGEQLRLKERLLRQTLEHALDGVSLPIRPIVPAAAPWQTRSKIHFLVASVGGKLTLAHHPPHSHKALPIRTCPVHAEPGNRVAQTLLGLLQQHGVPAYSEGGGGVARHIVVRVAGRRPDSPAAEPDMHVTLVVTRCKQPLLAAIGRELLRAEPCVRGFHANVHALPGPLIFGRHTVRLVGQERLVEPVAGLEFLVSPTSFFQTSATGAAQLAEIVLRQVPADRSPILDLYAGVGLFSLPLAQRGHAVTAVEENPTAVEDGLESLRHNGVSGCQFVRGPVEATIRKLADRQAYDTVILDPPRDGCPDWVLRRLASRGPARIIDVSCSPTALAADLAALTRCGYRVAEIQPLDLFPHTPHIESVTRLERAGKRTRN